MLAFFVKDVPEDSFLLLIRLRFYHALALRLTMSEQYLQEHRVFLIMNDHLTEMDITRRENASGSTHHFAKQKQVIILIC
jgi:hypothetical protein